jgi:hypothetical protein
MPNNSTLQLPSNSVSVQQSLAAPLAGTVLDTTLNGSELATVFEGDGSYDEDTIILREFEIRTF